MWEKEKLLVTSNFSFSHSVFNRLLLQTRKSQGLLGKELTGINKERVNQTEAIKVQIIGINPFPNGKF